MTINKDTPDKELIFTLDKAHKALLALANDDISEADILALVSDITEATRELTLRHD